MPLLFAVRSACSTYLHCLPLSYWWSCGATVRLAALISVFVFHVYFPPWVGVPTCLSSVPQPRLSVPVRPFAPNGWAALPVCDQHVGARAYAAYCTSSSVASREAYSPLTLSPYRELVCPGVPGASWAAPAAHSCACSFSLFCIQPSFQGGAMMPL